MVLELQENLFIFFIFLNFIFAEKEKNEETRRMVLELEENFNRLQVCVTFVSVRLWR